MKHDDSQKDHDFEEEDFEFESEEEVIGEETSLQRIKELRLKLKEITSEKQKLAEDLQRAKADFVNIRRRDEADLKKALELANESLVLEIIPVLDSFEMAFSHPSWQEAPPEFGEGIKRIYEQLKNVLVKNEVEIIDPTGHRFDPAVHTAVSVLETDKESEDHVVDSVMQKGYKLGNKIIRSPKVTIKEFKK